jgi:uncharacterized protein (DUF433 family)
MIKVAQNALDVPNYGMIEASRFFHIPASTVSFWANKERLFELSAPRWLSFRNMVELYVIKGLRELHSISPGHIRQVLAHIRSATGSRHPFADYKIVTDKKWVLFYVEGTILENASLYGQLEMEPLVKTYLHRVIRDELGLATRIFPYTRREQMRAAADPPRTIVIDPTIRSGLPVLAGSRLTTAILASRYRGGDSISALARSYGRPAAEIQEAVEWELGKEIKAA